jgi:DNA-binding PadR family transcriptional regulator
MFLMNTLAYILLGILAREPLSGYDLARLLKKHFGPFWAISHTQIYPALAQLVEAGFTTYEIIEQQARRPDKKIYQITEAGQGALRAWVEAPTSPAVIRDEFLLKAYSLWVADPEHMQTIFREQIALHQERLFMHEQELEAKRTKYLAMSQGSSEALVMTELIFKYTISYEQNYVSWCNGVLHYLEQREEAHRVEEI